MEYLFPALIFFIAFLYSSVGHGGATGYLALMALMGMAPAFMKPTSLTLNVFVSAISFMAFARAGYFKLRLILPFIITSVPCAFAGALVPVKTNLYEVILAICLLIAVFRILFVRQAVLPETNTPPLWAALLTGAVLGFLSGMLGIGGGIILSPVLILFHWANIKESAAASAMFIFLNSVSGLSALLISGLHYDSKMMIWVITGIAGGVAGSYAGSMLLQQSFLKYILAAVLLVASIKLFIF